MVEDTGTGLQGRKENETSVKMLRTSKIGGLSQPWGGYISDTCRHMRQKPVTVAFFVSRNTALVIC